MTESKAPRNRRARTAQLIISGVTAILLVAIGGIVLVGWPSDADGASADIPSGSSDAWVPTADLEVDESRPAWLEALSAGLEDGDRAKFLSMSSGQGAEALARWWDGTERIGRTLSFADSYDTMDSYEAEKPPSYLMLGGQLRFASHPDRGSGTEDAGLQLTQNFAYELVLDGAGEDAKISGLTPKNSPMPWDDGEIYAVERDHVTVYGMADERALVDANADVAEEAAVLAFDTLERIGGEAPIDGFVVAFTDREDRFDRWFGEDIEMNAAGFAGSTLRPNEYTDSLPPSVATGTRSSGSLVALGPASTSNREQVLVHEFAHVIQESAVPYELMLPQSAAPTEGFARYFENAAGVGDPYFADPAVRASILSRGESAMSDELLVSADANAAYAVAGSFYQFVEDSGGSAWQLALDRDGGFSMDLRAKLQDDAFGEAEWQAWAAAQ